MEKGRGSTWMLLYCRHRRNQSGREKHAQRKNMGEVVEEKGSEAEIQVERCGRIYAT